MIARSIFFFKTRQQVEQVLCIYLIRVWVDSSRIVSNFAGVPDLSGVVDLSGVADLPNFAGVDLADERYNSCRHSAT